MLIIPTTAYCLLPTALFTMKRFIILTIAVLTFISGAAQAQLPEIAGRIRSMAHRGDLHNAPENTIPSFKLAIATGIDSCEFDVQRTKDGVLVLSHDETLSRASAGASTAKIADMTFEEVRKAAADKSRQGFTAEVKALIEKYGAETSFVS